MKNKIWNIKISPFRLLGVLISAILIFAFTVIDGNRLVAQGEYVQQSYSINLDPGEYKQFPHFEISYPEPGSKGQVLDLSGWDVGDSFSKMTMRKIREAVDAAYKGKFNIVYLRVDWSSVEPVENQLVQGDLNRIGNLLDEIDNRNTTSEDGHKVRVIIALELDRPPAWFKKDNPVSVMSHINPFRETQGPMGTVKNANDYTKELDYGILNNPDYMKAAKKVINDIVHHFKNHPALFGWALTSPSSPLNYPGAGKDGVGGFADYSMYTRSQFFDDYRIEEGYTPIARESQGTPDLRDEWLAWDKFRRDMQRATVDEFGMQIYNIDMNHPIFVLFWGVMAYEGDNGYRSQVWGNDYYYQLTQRYVNGALIPFMLSSKTFDYPSGVDDMDSIHQLRAAVEIAQRHGKVPLLIVEKSWRNPPSLNDIDKLAHLAVALGVDIIWSHNSMSERSPAWSFAEKAAIERTTHLNLLPLPDKRQRAEIAVLDYPFELSKFYSEKDKELERSLAILDAFEDAGFHFTVVASDEIIPKLKTDEETEGVEIPEWIKDIHYVAPLAPNMSEYMPQRVSQFFDVLRGAGIEPFVLQRQLIESFICNNFDDPVVQREIQEKFSTGGVKHHGLFNNKCHIVVNWPYVFINTAKKNSKDLRILLSQYSDSGRLLSGSDTLVFYDACNDKDFKNALKLNQISGDLDFIIPSSSQDCFLLVWLPKMEKYKKAVIAHRLEIDRFHRLTLLKRSLPIALILTVIVITLGVLFTIQLYHPTIAKKRRKKRRSPPQQSLHEPKDYFTPDD